MAFGVLEVSKDSFDCSFVAVIWICLVSCDREDGVSYVRASADCEVHQGSERFSDREFGWSGFFFRVRVEVGVCLHLGKLAPEQFDILNRSSTFSM